MTRQPSKRKAAAWVSGWLLLMLVIVVAGKEATRTLHVFQIMEMRSLLGLLLLYPLVRREGGFAWDFRTGRIGQHAARNVFHYAAQFGWLFALTLIPVAQVVAIEFTMPVWTAILAVSFLGERMSAARLLAIRAWRHRRCRHRQAGARPRRPGSARRPRRRSRLRHLDGPRQVADDDGERRRHHLWMLVIQSVIGIAPALYVWREPTAGVWPWVVLIAFCGTYSHYCMTQALRNADATTVVPMDFLRVPLSAVVGWLVYAEAIDVFTAFGAGLILAGNLINLRSPPPRVAAAPASRPVTGAPHGSACPRRRAVGH